MATLDRALKNAVIATKYTAIEVKRFRSGCTEVVDCDRIIGVPGMGVRN